MLLSMEANEALNDSDFQQLLAFFELLIEIEEAKYLCQK